jgi:hypothetical protein
VTTLKTPDLTAPESCRISQEINKLINVLGFFKPRNFRHAHRSPH